MKKSMLFTLLAFVFSGITASAQSYTIEVIDDCTNLPLANYYMGFHYTTPGGAWATSYGYTNANGKVFPPAFKNSVSTCGYPVLHPDYQFLGTIVSSSPSGTICWESHTGTTVRVRNYRYTGFKINGKAVSTNAANPIVYNWCGGNQLMLNNESWYAPNINMYNLSINSQGSTYKTTGWVNGSCPTNVDLLQPSLLGQNPPAGTYEISLKNTFCGGSTLEYKAYITIKKPTPISVSNIFVNGQSTNWGIPTILLCNNAPVNVTLGEISGEYTSMDIQIERGSFNWWQMWEAEGISDVLTVEPHDVNGDINLSEEPAFATVMAFNPPNLKITITFYDICGNPHKVTGYVHLQHETTVSFVDYSLNGITPGNPNVAATIWLCNGNTALNFYPMVNTTSASVYTIRAERGFIGSNGFQADFMHPAVAYGPINGALPSFLNLAATGNLASYLAGYNGVVKISFTVNGPCGNEKTTSYLFDIQNPSALIDFDLSNFYCPNNGRSARQSDLNFVSFTQPTTTTNAQGVCYKGWLGAQSCGIYFVQALVSGVAASQINILVEEVDGTTGTVIGTTPLANYTTTGAVPGHIGFNQFDLANGHFTNYYATIKNNNTYKVTVSVNTGCGPMSEFSYFKIYDGGPGGATLKGAPDENAELPTLSSIKHELRAYPNPASNIINLEWTNEGEENENAELLLTDITGRIVNLYKIKELKGNNKFTVDVSQFSAGMYHYKLSTVDGIKNGKISIL